HDDAGRIEFAAAFGHDLEQRLHGVAEFADREDAGHAGAALERVQVALQADDEFAVGGVVAQVGQHAVGVVEQVFGLFQEDVQQLDVQVGGVELGVRVFGVAGQRHVCACAGVGAFGGFGRFGFGGFGFDDLRLDDLGFDDLGLDNLRLGDLGFDDFGLGGFGLDDLGLGGGLGRF